MNKILLSLALILASTVLTGQGSVLDKLKPEHPRLLVDAERVQELKVLAQTDTLLAGLIQMVHSYADSALLEPVIKYLPNPGGCPELKPERRAAMFRVFNCGMTYLLTGDTLYAHRVKQDLLGAVDMPDWGSCKFLNTGEICAFMGIGYDWIHDYLTEEERQVIRDGIVHHGLSQGVKAFNGEHSNGWWIDQPSNWNQVCAGGLAISALSLAEYYPDTALQILEGATASIPGAMDGYMPEGAWMEGPTYWAYGTTYNGLLMSALRTSMDTLLGLEQAAGYDALGLSGAYHIHTVGPATNLYFNYGDSKTTLYYSPVLFWLAREYGEAAYAWFERIVASNDLPRMRRGGLMDDDTLDRFLALLVAWYSDEGKDLSPEDYPLDAVIRGEGVAMGAFHSDWSKNGIYFGFKAGKPHARHAQMDIGTFVLDAKGQRWALDLGYGNNDLPGFWDFNGKRWTYYRNSNFGHNTLVFWDQLQNKDAFVPVSDFQSWTDSATATLDMSGTYHTFANSCVRNFSFPGRDHILVTDHIDPSMGFVEVRWAMITPAELSLHGREALLRQNGREFRVRILEPEGAEFYALETRGENPHPDERSNEGTTMLALKHYQEEMIPFRIRVELNPTDTTLSPGETGVWESLSRVEPAWVGAWPNPFADELMLSFDLPVSERVQLGFYDASGRLVEQVIDEMRPAGRNVIYHRPVSLASGVYILKLDFAGGSLSRQVVKGP